VRDFVGYEISDHTPHVRSVFFRAIDTLVMKQDGVCKQLIVTIMCCILTSAYSQSLKIGESSPVTVTFYEQPPDMVCSDGWGSCGMSTDTTGNTDFIKTSLYPLHAASENYVYIGG
jgi:hypothetical protein